MKFTSLAVAIAFGFSGAAFAQETESTEAQTKMKIEDTKEKNKVDGDIDQEITNAKMRAESGSKSKWSLSAGLQYKGGTLSRGFGAKRPNITGQPGAETSSSLSIDPAIRYRWTKNDSISMGNSFAIVTPFQGKTTKNQFNFRDPDVSYNRVGKIGTLQTNGSVSVAVGTSNESKDLDQAWATGASYTFLKGFENGLTIGTSFSVGYQHYTSKPGQGKPASKMDDPDQYAGDARNQFDVGIYPFAEYEFNDRYSARTVFGYFNWQHLYGDTNKWRLLQTYVYQSVGVGISVTRNIHLYPNIQFVPDNIRSDFTNVAMTATLNVF